jgi:hypothetical protein
MARWGMPSSQKALMDATKKRAEKLQAKGRAGGERRSWRSRGSDPLDVGAQGPKEGEASIDVCGFLTTEPNAVVRPIHPKAMPRNPDD